MRNGRGRQDALRATFTISRSPRSWNHLAVPIRVGLVIVMGASPIRRTPPATDAGRLVPVLLGVNIAPLAGAG
jgi:hypothetical protein